MDAIYIYFILRDLLKIEYDFMFFLSFCPEDLVVAEDVVGVVVRVGVVVGVGVVVRVTAAVDTPVVAETELPVPKSWSSMEEPEVFSVTAWPAILFILYNILHGSCTQLYALEKHLSLSSL